MWGRVPVATKQQAGSGKETTTIHRYGRTWGKTVINGKVGKVSQKAYGWCRKRRKRVGAALPTMGRGSRQKGAPSRTVPTTAGNNLGCGKNSTQNAAEVMQAGTRERRNNNGAETGGWVTCKVAGTKAGRWCSAEGTGSGSCSLETQRLFTTQKR